MLNINKKRIYLDYASGAPINSEVIRAISKLLPFSANPSSIHRDGVFAKKILEDSRDEIAKTIYAHSDEIFFTGSGTESDNIAVLGVFKKACMSKQFENCNVHVVTTAIEHPAVLNACRHIEEVGGKVTYLAVDSDGQINLNEFKNALRPETVLVSIAYANNEIGSIQNIKEIAKEIRRYKKTEGNRAQAEQSSHDYKHQTQNTYPVFHTDACQAGSYLNLNVEQLGVDLLTLNGTKLGGPHGIGILYKRRGTPISPIIYGGDQEGGLRSGTENVALSRGMALALVKAQNNIVRSYKKTGELQKYFSDLLIKKFPNCRINGGHVKLPNNVSVSFPNLSSELLVLELDARGISVSLGSACSSAKEAGSHVLEALYGSEDSKKYGTVRFTFGPETKKSDITYVLKCLEKIISKYEKYK